jgi:hypothetical protein
MQAKTEITFDIPRRLAFRASPKVLRLVLPHQVPGVYILLRSDGPFYVGRSDICLRTRLTNHELLLATSYVVWETCSSPEVAFHLEASWFHFLDCEEMLENKIHPARPTGHAKNCPFCDTGDMEALRYVLPHLQTQSVVNSVIID